MFVRARSRWRGERRSAARPPSAPAASAARSGSRRIAAISSRASPASTRQRSALAGVAASGAWLRRHRSPPGRSGLRRKRRWDHSHCSGWQADDGFEHLVGAGRRRGDVAPHVARALELELRKEHGAVSVGRLAHDVEGQHRRAAAQREQRDAGGREAARAEERRQDPARAARVLVVQERDGAALAQRAQDARRHVVVLEQLRPGARALLRHVPADPGIRERAADHRERDADQRERHQRELDAPEVEREDEGAAAPRERLLACRSRFSKRTRRRSSSSLQARERAASSMPQAVCTQLSRAISRALRRARVRDRRARGSRAPRSGVARRARTCAARRARASRRAAPSGSARTTPTFAR